VDTPIAWILTCAPAIGQTLATRAAAKLRDGRGDGRIAFACLVAALPPILRSRPPESGPAWRARAMPSLRDTIEQSNKRRGVSVCTTCGIRHDGAAWSAQDGWHDKTTAPREKTTKR
jgi:hypothetical protein